MHPKMTNESIGNCALVCLFQFVLGPIALKWLDDRLKRRPKKKKTRKSRR